MGWDLTEASMQEVPAATPTSHRVPPSALGSDASVLSQGQIERFHVRGYLALDPIATPAEVADLRTIYRRLFEDRAGWNDGNYLDFGGPDDANARLPQILMPSLYEPALRASRLHAVCHAMARQLLGDAAEFHF